mgnify:CR=1 FL=1
MLTAMLAACCSAAVACGSDDRHDEPGSGGSAGSGASGGASQGGSAGSAGAAGGSACGDEGADSLTSPGADVCPTQPAGTGVFRHVSASSGSDDNDGLTADRAHQSVGAAIQAAMPGDVILIAEVSTGRASRPAAAGPSMLRS